jgi:glc operon protein GlcG
MVDDLLLLGAGSHRSFSSMIAGAAKKMPQLTGGNLMTSRILHAVILASGLFASGHAFAQQQAAPAPAAPPDLNAVPDKMPFNIPFGASVGLEQAQALIQAGVAEANKRGWPEVFAVVDISGNLVAFARMDGAQFASVAIAEHKARTAARYRRPTKAFEDAVQKFGFNYILTLDDVIASRGGVPLVDGGKIIGAIGCSGATGSQDEALCNAAAASINK